MTDKDKKQLKSVTKKYSFRSNSYYMSLIDWDDPDDPIKRLIIPDKDELYDWGELDPSNEKKYTVVRGVQHKYTSTALILLSNNCGGICRYCFRKRIFKKDQIEYLRNYEKAISYIKDHEEITNILLTGGDPLILSTNKLEKIIGELRKIDHVKIIRIGSKMLAFNPSRIIDDKKLLKMISKYSNLERKIYIITHFTHPRELSKTSLKAINLLFKAGAILTNQTPLINGINSDSSILKKLFQKLSYCGIPSYYVFQCRPSSGNKKYSLPVEKGYSIFQKACSQISGLAKRATYVMSHSTGKIEVLGKDNKNIYFKYRRSARNQDSNRLIKAKRNKDAYWFDDYELMAENIS